MLNEEGAFPILRAYLRLASRGEKIAAFRSDHSYWKDIGRIASLQELQRDLASG